MSNAIGECNEERGCCTRQMGHIAAKLQAPTRTAGLTIGTPVLFSSVAHGSALDIAGTDRASPEAMIEAVRRLVGAASHAPPA